MGLLDDVTRSVKSFQRNAEAGVKAMPAFFAQNNASPQVAAIAARYASGEPVSVMLGLEKGHRDAIVKQGLQYLQISRLDEAHDWLSFALLADPLDERALYGLGVVAQLRSDVKAAANYFIHFIALDATNPDGLLRLGECLLANRETDAAVSSFKGAIALCEAGYGQPRQLANAQALLALTENAGHDAASGHTP